MIFDKAYFRMPNTPIALIRDIANMYHRTDSSIKKLPDLDKNKVEKSNTALLK